jgi:hypothetical protein
VARGPVAERPRRASGELLDGGLHQASGLSKLPSFTRPEDARAVAYERLERRIGAVTPAELAAMRRILRAFLDL